MTTPTPEQQAAHFEGVSARLRMAAEGLVGINMLIPDIPYLDYDHKKSKGLPLGFAHWLLNHIADRLDARCSELRATRKQA